MLDGQAQGHLHTAATVRSLDAIHVGTALRFRHSLTSFLMHI